MDLDTAVDYVETQLIEREEMRNGLLIVRVGTDSQPASQQDIDNTIRKLTAAIKEHKDLIVLISHHTLNFQTLDLRDAKDKLLFVRVGTSSYAATEEDIEATRDAFIEALEGREGPKIVVLPYLANLDGVINS